MTAARYGAMGSALASGSATPSYTTWWDTTGTIGSFLAQQLAQSGAGSRGGRLTIVDPDVLKGANLGRHLLGSPFLDHNKAKACADFLREQLPYLDITGNPGSIFDNLDAISRHDLIIDATGEEALSIALNERAVTNRPKFPPILFTWIEGNGAATVGFLMDSPQMACRKCLKSDLSGPSRYRLVRRDVPTEVGRNLACGDAHFIPYPVSRAAAAASLACDMVLDWAGGSVTHRWRSLTLDHRKANTIKDCNPSKVADCPCCGGRGP